MCTTFSHNFKSITQNGKIRVVTLLHYSDDISEEVMAQIEFFFYLMYGCLKFSSIDAVRLEIFCKEISTEKGNKLISQ